MRAWTALFAAFATLTPLASGADKLTEQDRIELMRGLVAEYATVKQLLPRAKKALPFEATGTFDKKAWQTASRQYGPAGRVGDIVQITKVFIEADKLVLQINGGFNGGRRWFDSAQIGGGVGGNGSMTPIGRGDSNAPGGTTIEILFHKPLEPMKAAEVKKMLAPVLDFEKRSATEIYAEVLPPRSCPRKCRPPSGTRKYSRAWTATRCCWRWAVPLTNRARSRTVSNWKTGFSGSRPARSCL
jgi:hypothetical protein